MKRIERIAVHEARDAGRRAAVILARRPSVRLVFLFGSTADPTAREVRDVDLAVLTDAPLALDERLRLGAEIETATGAPTDLIFLDDAPVSLAREVVDHGTCLFARSPEEEVEFVTRARARYWDFRPFLDEQWRLSAARQEERRGTQA